MCAERFSFFSSSRWGDNWHKESPNFFAGMPSGVYDNTYDSLDDSPVSWHITEPVDPTEYQGG